MKLATSVSELERRPRAVAIERTYVPEPTRRSSVTSVPLYAMTSSALTCERRTGMSTSTPRRASRYARSPPTFTAEAAGIGSSISPRRRSSAESTVERSGAACSATTAPSGSPVEVVAVRSTSVT